MSGRLPIQRSIATVSLSGTLEDKLSALAAAGFDGIELFENDLISCPFSPAELRYRLLELDLDLLLYQPFRDFEAVPAGMLLQNLRRAECKFELMEQLGAETILACSSVSEHAIDDDELAAEHLYELGERARVHGIAVAYEALAWGRHVNTFEHAWRIVKTADHPNVGICLDSFHILARGDHPAPIANIPGEKIFFVQLADAPALAMDVLQWSRHHRCLPGQGSFDIASFVSHVLEAGYTGPLSLELFNDVLRQASPRRTAVDAMRSLLALEDSIAKRSPELTARLRLSTLPPPAPIRGYAFAELAVDRLAESEVEQLLGALGFSPAGRHRSKPVELWQQGGARVLLNRGDEPAVERAVQGSARVSTIAVDSLDPVASAKRADLLLAPKLHRRRGPREAELAAIAAPDGMPVFFCGSEQCNGPLWLDDFIALNGSTTVDPELIGIDHIALSEPPELFDQMALFFRSVLGMEPLPSHELVAPHGLVRSRALASDDGEVRLVLNAPPLGLGHPQEVQHVAFACRDIFATCERVRARGVPTLPIPDNYYDDLAARGPLPDELIDSMRALGVLYDRGERGEFFHFYTPPAAAGLFFEIVQRRDGYSGYGATNSAVRMAVQRV